jgi:hypothetical protein
MIGWVERFSADHRAGYGPAADIAADRRRCADRILKFHIGEDKQSAGRIALTACRSALFGQRFAFGGGRCRVARLCTLPQPLGLVSSACSA